MPRRPTWTPADTRLAGRVGIGFVAFAVTLLVWASGIDVRFQAWRDTEPGRFTGDINNAFRQGTRTRLIGFFDRYDDEALEGVHSYMGLDYAPGRLAVATLWVGWVNDQPLTAVERFKVSRYWPEHFYEGARRIDRSEQLVRPLMWLNIVGETASMLAVFWLVWRYLTTEHGSAGPALKRPGPIHPGRTNSGPERPGPTRPGSVGAFAKRTVVATIAATLFWFNPALISNAHCWPQWDSWLLPFFLWAVVAGSHGRFFIGGVLIAIGAMFKGQILFAAPVLILWPLFQGRPVASFRWVVGFLFGMAAATAPWLVRTPGSLIKLNRFSEGTFQPGAVSGYAVVWLAGLAVAFGLVVMVAKRKWSWKVNVPVAVVAPGLALWPFWGWAVDYLTVAVALMAVTAVVLMFTRWRAVPYAAAVWAAGGLFTCLVGFDGNSLWYIYGFSNGTTNRPELALNDTNNLPAILQYTWNWDLYDSVHDVPAGPSANELGERFKKIDKHYYYRPNHAVAVPLKVPLVIGFGAVAVLSAIAMAVQDRRRSRNFLPAMVSMWVMLFAVMPQMHQRYLLWGATLSMTTVALGPGWAVLGVFLSLVAWSQEASSMYDVRWTRAVRPEVLTRIIDNWHPGLGWAILLAGLIYLVTGFKRHGGRSDRPVVLT